MKFKQTLFERSYFNVLEILIILYPISIIFSNFLSNSIVYFSSFSIIFYIFYNKKYEVFNNKFYIIFIIFCCYLTARSLFINSDDYLFSLKSSIFLIRYLLFIIAIKFIIENNQNFLKKFFKFFIVFFFNFSFGWAYSIYFWCKFDGYALYK